MKRILLVAIVAGLMLPLQADAAQKELKITNRRDAFPIWKVFITPAGQAGWGQDQLGDKVISAGESHTWTIPWNGCYVDVKAETFTGLSTERLKVNVCGGFEWTIYDEKRKQQSKNLKVINRRQNFPIWKVYITPAGRASWGQDQLGDQIINAGESHTWNIPWDGCYVDVKAVTFTGLSTERRNLNVCGGMVWSVYDNGS